MCPSTCQRISVLRCSCKKGKCPPARPQQLQCRCLGHGDSFSCTLVNIFMHNPQNAHHQSGFTLRYDDGRWNGWSSRHLFGVWHGFWQGQLDFARVYQNRLKAWAACCMEAGEDMETGAYATALVENLLSGTCLTHLNCRGTEAISDAGMAAII